MSLREKEKAKEQQDKYQAILSSLLKDEDNKYCVDCDAKGPRWASWNLGIFLCIRCAGIHRNLGVHISKVKSVNLDTWTAEQVAMMQEIGNSRARAVYEANIPDGFRRPQSDSALEALIRSKYEQKKYIAREWVPPKPTVPREWLEDSKSEKKKARAKPASGQIQLGGMAPKGLGKPNVAATSGESTGRPAQPVKTEVKLSQATQPVQAVISSAANDLLGLDLSSHQTLQAVAPTASSSSNELLDLFGGPQPGTTANAVAPSANNDLMNGSSSEANLFEGDGLKEEKKTSTKDSIMALFGGTGGGGGAAQVPQQMYNIPAPSASFAQNGSVVSQLVPASTAIPGAVSNSFALTMMSSSQAMPANSQQMMMYGAVNQSKQLHNPLSSLTSQPQQQLSTLATTPIPSQPQNFGQNQQSTSTLASAQAQKLFNLAAPISQNYNTVGSQMQPLMSSRSSAGQSILQPSGTGLAPSSSKSKVSPASTTSFGQSFRPPNPMYFGQNQACYYGGMYMPQGQQPYGGMMVQHQNMMGQPPSMMGYQPNMMGQQPQAMMGTNTMNGSQMGMYNNQMMPGAGGMYTPQQMQQLQFQQMQQQMAAMNMGGPQQMQGGWGGNPSTGQTLSNNLWQ